MPADNQVILEGLAKLEPLRQAIQQLVADGEGALARLGKDHPLVLDVASAQIQLDKIIAALRRTRDEAGAPRVVNVRTEEAEKRVASLVTQVKAIAPAIQESARGGDPLAPFRASLDLAEQEVSQFVERTTQGSAKFGVAMEGAAAKSRLALQALAKQIRETAAAGSPVPPQVVAQVDRLEQEYRQATTAAHQFRIAQAQVRAEIRSTTPPINDLNASIQRAGQALKAFAVAAAIRELKQLGTETFTVSEQFKAIDRQLEAALGSSQKAAKGFAFVKQESDRLGFGLLGAVDGYARLASAARDTRLEGEGINRIFTQFAERATVARLSSEDFAGVIRALEQILSKGTLSMEELRQQLGDRLPGTLRLAGKSLGFSSGQFKELFDLIKSNSIDSIEFLEQFGEVVQREIAGQVPAASRAATAEVNRLRNEFLLAKRDAGDELTPAVAELSKTLAELLREGRPTIELFGKISGALLTLAIVAVRVQAVLPGVGGAFDALSFSALGAARAVGAALEMLARSAGLDEFANRMRESLSGLDDMFREVQERLAVRQRNIVENIRKIGRGADDLAPSLDNAGDASTEFGDKIDYAARALARAIDETIELGRALPKTGDIQREEADKIAKAIDKQLKAIRELPEEEEKAFSARADLLGKLRERVEEFTTEYEKEQKKQQRESENTARKEEKDLNRRGDQFLAFVKRLRDIAAGVETAGETDAARALREAQEELSGIESQGFLSDEDAARAEELRAGMFELRRAAEEAGDAVRNVGTSAREAADEQREALREQVAESESFRTAFLDLPPAIQAAVEELVTGFERSLQVQGANVDETDRFNRALVSLFSQGGALAQDFAKRLAVGTGDVRGMGEAFEVLRSQAAQSAEVLGSAAASIEKVAAAVSQLMTVAPAATEATAAIRQGALDLDGGFAGATQSANALQGALIPLATTFSHIPPAGEAAAQGADQAAQGFIRASDAAAKLDGEQGHLVEGYAAVTKAAGEAASITIKTADETFHFGAAVDEAATSASAGAAPVGELGDQVGGVGAKAGIAASGLEKVAGGIKATAGVAADAATQAGKAGDALEEAGTNAAAAADGLSEVATQAREAGSGSEEGATGIGNLGTAAGTAVEPLGQVAVALDGIKTADPAKTFSDTATEADKAATAAGDLATGVGKVGEAVKAEAAPLKDMAELLRQIRVELEGAKKEQASFRVEIEKTLEPCKQLVECLQAAAAA